MARTNSAAVQLLMAPGQDYDTDAAPSLTPFIDSATVIVTRVAACAIQKEMALTTEELELIERWLAAYLYTRSDPIYQSKSTGGQSASFVADSKATTERYKAGALMVDPSGCLQSIMNSVPKAGAYWLGKTETEQLTYDERN